MLIIRTVCISIKRRVTVSEGRLLYERASAGLLLYGAPTLIHSLTLVRTRVCGCIWLPASFAADFSFLVVNDLVCIYAWDILFD